jgi:hypothetical protein
LTIVSRKITTLKQVNKLLLPTYIRAILDAAKEYAKTLGCKVFILSDNASGTQLISKGSSCPYEYVDASGRVKKEGVFSVYGKELYFLLNTKQ